VSFDAAQSRCAVARNLCALFGVFVASTAVEERARGPATVATLVAVRNNPASTRAASPMPAARRTSCGDSAGWQAHTLVHKVDTNSFE
jgi:hypothetical protein